MIRIRASKWLSHGSCIVRDKDGNTIFVGKIKDLRAMPSTHEILVSESDHASLDKIPRQILGDVA